MERQHRIVAAAAALALLLICTYIALGGTDANNSGTGIRRKLSLPDPKTVTPRDFANFEEQVQQLLARSSRTTTALPSGWDESGLEMYQHAKKRLTQKLLASAAVVQTHQVKPLEPVKTAGGHAGDSWFVDNLVQGDEEGPGWEPQTFHNFFQYLSNASCRYYVGFGTWIGPTLFFAAQLVDEAFGIEADPVAFAKVETNLALNHEEDWARRVHLNPHAVGLGSDPLDAAPTSHTMRSARPGNSCSGLGDRVNCGKGEVTWQVDSYNLPYLLGRWGVPSTNELFIKVDVESFECDLVPSWLPWLSSIAGPKPIFHLAVHGQISPCDEVGYQSLFQFAKLYSFKNEECLDEANEMWTCHTGEFLFSDGF